MMPTKKLVLYALVGLLAPVAEVAAQNLRVDGFGSVGFSCLDSRAADYPIDDQPIGPGRTARCDAGSHAVLGLQFTLDLTPVLGLGLQVVADRNPDRGYAPAVTVAQLRWKIGADTTLRFGRMPTAAFLHEEDRKVRFAQPWVRPPQEVYGLVPTFANDGAEFIHVSRFDGWNLDWHGGITTVRYDTPVPNSRDTVEVKAHRAIFLSMTLRDANTLLKLGYGNSRVSIPDDNIRLLLTGLRQIPGGAALADELSAENSPAQLLTFGFRREQGDWLLLAELGYRTHEGYPRDQYGAYLTLGRRLGLWMPYATLAQRRTRGPASDERAWFLRPQVETLLAATRNDSASVSFGLAYNIHEKATLKLQMDRLRPRHDSWGLYTNPGPSYDYARPGSQWLMSLGLDFIF